MTISLQRLFEGVIATLRSDVIPHIPDAYGRGQAVGVIDVLNNIASRVEWCRAPLLARLRSKEELLRTVHRHLPQIELPSDLAVGPETTSAELEAILHRLDAIISEAIAIASADDANVDEAGKESREQVLALIKLALHAELIEDAKRTRKPLFAEIAAGPGKDGPPG